MTTCAALITPPGAAAIAVIQIVGPDSISVINQVFRPFRGDAGSFSADGLHYGVIFEDTEQIDKVMVAADPKKEIVDINCHGGPRVVQRILMLLQKHGVKISTWQKLTVAESVSAEVELILPQAKTELAVRAIAGQYPGGLSEKCEMMAAGLQKDEMSLTAAKSEITMLLGTFRWAQRLLHAPMVVLTGPVNAGKSTLVNALTGKTQSLVADMPGVTRDWTSQLADINGLGVNLVDTAGRRASGDEIERESLVQADKVLAEADLILLVVEPVEDMEEMIFDLMDELPDTIDIQIVVNKIDLQPELTRKKGNIYVSALQGQNLKQLRETISSEFGFSYFDPNEPLVFTEQQYELLLDAGNAESADELLDYLKELVGRG
ncbi:MAG: GTP-binding protein [Planctomycetes bacterium]|nr:GTP-binding protein [Planctomycetota bacterium]